MTHPESSAEEVPAERAAAADTAWLQTARKLDDQAWDTLFGQDRDICALRAERNVLRHVPTPVTVRCDSGPAEHALRVVTAGLRAGTSLTVSPVPAAARTPATPSSQAQPAQAPVSEALAAGAPGTGLLSPQAVQGWIDELRRAYQGNGMGDAGRGAPVDVVIEDRDAFPARAKRLAMVPPEGVDRGDARIRLISDWTADPEGARAARHALFEALEGSVDVAVYSGPVVSAGEVELLPFLKEQAISVTAHRFGTPDHLTDEIL